MKRLSISQFHTFKGRLHARKGQWHDAEQCFEAAISNSPVAENYYFLGNAQFKLRKFDRALESTRKAVELDPAHPSWFIRLGALLERSKNPEGAAGAYSRAIELDPRNSDWHQRLKRAKSHTSKTASQPPGASELGHTTSAQAMAALPLAVRRALASNLPGRRREILADAFAKDPHNAALLFQLALSMLETGDTVSAAERLTAALRHDPEDAGLAFHLGWSLRLGGHHKAARDAFNRGIRLAADPTISRVGPGAYFQREGLWHQAATLYEDAALERPEDGDLHYRAGLTRERQCEWQAASEHHHQALAIDPESAGRHFRLGMARERSGNMRAAAESYAAAVRLDAGSRTEWRYRLISCLNRAGAPEEAINALRADPSMTAATVDRQPLSDYELSLQRLSLEYALNSHDGKRLVERGNAMMRYGLCDEAARAFEAATRQDGDQSGGTYLDLARANLANGNPMAALEAFLSSQKFRSPVDIGRHSYFEKPWQLNAMEYVEYSQAYPLDESHVVFESYQGTKIDCNPAAIYRALREDPSYDHLRFSWVVNGRCNVPRDVAEDPRVSLVPRGSTLYRRILGTAKYLITNVSFPQYFVRREGQKYLNTWHGTPLKTLGKDLGSGFMEHSNINRNLLQTTHLLASNEHTLACLIERNEVGALFNGKVGALGTPRIDRMLGMTTEQRRDLFEKLGLPDSKRQVIFYAPTWRGAEGSKHFDAAKLELDLKALAGIGAHVLFRAHHAAERLLGPMSIDNVTIVPPSIDSYDVLAITDVLVTDYSSIFFDFLPRKKPIVFYAYDLDEYVSERGLYFSVEDMPGEIAYTIEELTKHLQQALESGIANPRNHELARSSFAPHEDGGAAGRAIDFLFRDALDCVVELPQSDAAPIVFRHNFQPGPANEEVLSTMGELTAAGQTVAVLFDKNTVRDNPKCREQFERLPEAVLRLAKTGAHIVSVEERWNINQYNRSHRFADVEQELLYRAAHEREFRRNVGTAHLAAVVQVNDMDPLGVAIMGSVQSQAGHRLLVSCVDRGSDEAHAAPPLGWYDEVVSSPSAIRRG